MLVFEKSRPGRGCDLLPASDVEIYLPEEKDKRELPLHLPELSEGELSRHYTELAKKSHGVNDGFYPLGSCTMKYNPKINEDMASLPGLQKSTRYSRSIPYRDVWKLLGRLRIPFVRSREWTV